MSEEGVVAGLIAVPFSRRTFADQQTVLQNGRPTPPLPLTERGKCGERHFNVDNYRRYPWMAGCEGTRRLYCWSCLLFLADKSPSTWAHGGFVSMTNLSKSAHRHQNSALHMQSTVILNNFGDPWLMDELQRCGHPLAPNNNNNDNYNDNNNNNNQLPQHPVRASSMDPSEPPSLPSPGQVTYHLRKSFEKKLSSAMDTLLKAAVLEITSAFDTVTVDHQMLIKQKMEEISTLRFQLEKAEKKLQERNEKRQRREDVSQTVGQTMPEIVVEVPDDWCAPLGCENVVDQTPSTSYAATESRGNSLCSLSVALWRLPDIKQEVQDDGYHIDSDLSDPDEGPKWQVEHTKDQQKPSSAPKLHQKKPISVVKSEPKPTQKAGDVYPCKFCSKVFDTEFGRSVHTRTHKRCTGCNKMFRFPSNLRAHLKACTWVNKVSVSTPLPSIDDPLHHKIKREKGSPGEDKPILPSEIQQPTRKRTFDKRESVASAKKSYYLPKRDKAFPCTGCEKRFCSIVWLRNHRSKYVMCSRCPERFCTRDILQSHIYNVHMQKPQEITAPSDAVDGESNAISAEEKQSGLDVVGC